MNEGRKKRIKEQIKEWLVKWPLEKLFSALISSVLHSEYDRLMINASIQYSETVEEIIYGLFATCTNSDQLVRNHLWFYFYKMKK